MICHKQRNVVGFAWLHGGKVREGAHFLTQVIAVVLVQLFRITENINRNRQVIIQLKIKKKKVFGQLPKTVCTLIYSITKIKLVISKLVDTPKTCPAYFLPENTNITVYFIGVLLRENIIRLIRKVI